MNAAFRVWVAGLAAVCQSAAASPAIANWNTVLHETFTQPFKVGVVAFHETGVDVAFTVNGAPVARVTDPTWNDRTGTFEYWIEIDPRQYAGGPLTVGAVAIPDGDGHDSLFQRR